MKVIYKPSVQDELNTRIREASIMGKRIERIELTTQEWAELVKECANTTKPVYENHEYRGVKIVVNSGL